MHNTKFFLNGWGKVLWLVFFLLSFQERVWAYDNPIQVTRSFFEDKQGLFSIDTVKNQLFQPYQGSLRKTHKHSVFWIKLQYTAPPTISPPLFLRVESVLPDSLCLYQNSSQDPVHQFNHISCIKNNTSQDVNAMLPSFKLLPVPVPQKKVMYLRVETTGVILIDTEIMSQEEVYRHNTLRTMVFGLHFGIMTCLFTWGLYCIWRGRGWIALIFTFFQGVTLGMDIIQSGYLPIFYAIPFDVHLVSNYLMLLSILCVILLNRFFVEQFNILTVQKYALNGLAGLIFLNIFLYISSQQIDLIHYSARLGLVHILVVLWILITLYQTKKVSIGFILVYGGLLTFSGLLGGLRFSDINFSVFQLQIFPPLVVTSLPLSFFLMYERTVLLHKKNQTLQIERALSRREYELERQQRLQQSAFMAMLTHELKSPLSVVSMVTDSRRTKESGQIGTLALTHLKKAIHDMQYLIDQCVDVDKWLDVPLNQNLVPITVTDILKEIISVHIGPDLERIMITNQTEKQAIFSNHMALHVILTNLIDNALKYSLPNTSILLHISLLEQTQNQLLVTVSNQIGVAGAPDLNLLFEKYYRASGAQRYCGTGLGLWLSRVLARRLQGDLQCTIENHIISFHLLHSIFTKSMK